MEELKILQTECHECRKCDIGNAVMDKGIPQVFSNMNPEAEVMIVGQSPGVDEVEAGQPFVGVSGQFFEKALKEVVGLERNDLYISNVVRCYTPENRKPFLHEFENCRSFLEREIKLVKPKVIVVLGAPAFKELTGMNGITKHRGNPTWSIRYEVMIFPMLHPSPHNTASADGRRDFYKDLEKLKVFLDGGQSDSSGNDTGQADGASV